MRKSEAVIVTLALGLLISHSASAQLWSGLADDLADMFHHWHHVKRAPAPLLAAGIPALMAVGSSALGTKIVRRFRRDKTNSSSAQ